MSYVEAAARAIAPVLRPGSLVILESTSPVGATERMSEWLAEARPDLTFPQQTGENSDIRVAHCPERVLPGRVMRELIANDRVIGGLTPRCASAAAALYRNFVQGDCFLTDARTAEMCKLTENAFRDVNIAFANELSMICDELGIDVWKLIELANRHPRVNILQPGPGVGGHCIAVDPWFIVHASPKQARLIRTARQVNDCKPDWVVLKVEEAVRECISKDPGKSLDDITIVCLGLAFKADIDDLRESPAMEITMRLATKYPGRVVAVEPNIRKTPQCLTEKGVALMEFDEAVAKGDLPVLLVDRPGIQGSSAGRGAGESRGRYQGRLALRPNGAMSELRAESATAAREGAEGLGKTRPTWIS